MAKKVTIHKKGKKPVSFQKGGLHKSVGVPMGQNIPDSKMQAAMHGDYGPMAKKQAVMAQGMLAKGRKTAAKKKGK